MRNRFILGLLLVLLFAFVVIIVIWIWPPDDPPTTTTTPPVRQISLLQVIEEPGQVLARVGGDLKNSCNILRPITPQPSGTTFVLDVQTEFVDTGTCADVVVPFTVDVPINVAGLPDGVYTVTVDGFVETFTLPLPSGASLIPNPTNVLPGGSLTLNGQSFPQNTQVEIGMGLVNGTMNSVSTVPSGENGTFSTPVVIPGDAVPNQQWVFSGTANGATTMSTPVTIVPPDQGDPPPVEISANNDGVNQATNGLFNKTYIFMIALNDSGQNGTRVDCNGTVDSVVPIAIDIDPTAGVMRAAYTNLLRINEQNFEGRHNALYQSSLSVVDVNIVNGVAIVYLTGTLLFGDDACEKMRAMAQLEQTALQFSTVDKVWIYLDNELIYPPGGRG